MEVWNHQASAVEKWGKDKRADAKVKVLFLAQSPHPSLPNPQIHSIISSFIIIIIAIDS